MIQIKAEETDFGSGLLCTSGRCPYLHKSGEDQSMGTVEFTSILTLFFSSNVFIHFPYIYMFHFLLFSSSASLLNQVGTSEVTGHMGPQY